MVARNAPSAKRGPRGPYAKSQHTRTSILDSALHVFAESGFRSGSLRTVAEGAGLTEAGLLHHFPSKSALLSAVLERRDDQTRTRLDIDPSSGIDVLRALLDQAEYNASTPGVVELYCTLSSEATVPGHPAHDYFADRYRMVTGIVSDALEDLAARGRLKPGIAPRTAAKGIIALMDGLQIQWLLDRESVDMAAQLREHFETLVDGPL